MSRILRVALALFLNGYHLFLSPFLPRSCRFYPSCSQYTAKAIQKYGIARGTVLGLGRIGRCHPWNAGGYDPVS